MRVVRADVSRRADDASVTNAFIYSADSPVKAPPKAAVKPQGKGRSKAALADTQTQVEARAKEPVAVVVETVGKGKAGATSVAELVRSIEASAIQSSPDEEDAFTQRSEVPMVAVSSNDQQADASDDGSSRKRARNVESSEEDEEDEEEDEEDVISLLVRELYSMQQERLAKKRNKQLAFAESAATAQVLGYLDQWAAETGAQSAAVDKLTASFAALVAEADEACKHIGSALKRVADEDATMTQEMVVLEAQTRACLEASEAAEEEVRAEVKALEGAVQRRKKQCVDNFRARGGGTAVGKTAEWGKPKGKGKGGLAREAWERV